VASGEADVAFMGWHADYPDADSFAYGCLHSRDGLAGPLCGGPRLDDLIERGRAEPDPSRRRALYLEMEDLLYAEALVLPLFHLQGYRLVRPELEGFAFNVFFPKVRYEELELFAARG
jgi:ABC-type oligopeptide transport system substrate-binding subunit